MSLVVYAFLFGFIGFAFFNVLMLLLMECRTDIANDRLFDIREQLDDIRADIDRLVIHLGADKCHETEGGDND